MTQIKKIKSYIKTLNSKLNSDDKVYKDLIKIKNLIIEAKKNNAKIFVFGNGGSAAIASHVSVDFTKNIKIKTFNFNDDSIITCFSNDYGYERWVAKCVELYAEKKDILILISSSGKSKNMINACKAAKKKKISKIITVTGNKKNNPCLN